MNQNEDEAKRRRQEAREFLAVSFEEEVSALLVAGQFELGRATLSEPNPCVICEVPLDDREKVARVDVDGERVTVCNRCALGIISEE